MFIKIVYIIIVKIFLYRPFTASDKKIWVPHKVLMSEIQSKSAINVSKHPDVNYTQEIKQWKGNNPAFYRIAGDCQVSANNTQLLCELFLLSFSFS
jgi:hypothetical protein